MKNMNGLKLRVHIIIKRPDRKGKEYEKCYQVI